MGDHDGYAVELWFLFSYEKVKTSITTSGALLNHFFLPLKLIGTCDSNSSNYGITYFRKGGAFKQVRI